MSKKDDLEAGAKVVFELLKGERGYKLTIDSKAYYFDNYNDLKKLIDDELKESNVPN
jgi:hypothetical protein